MTGIASFTCSCKRWRRDRVGQLGKMLHVLKQLRRDLRWSQHVVCDPQVAAWRACCRFWGRGAGRRSRKDRTMHPVQPAIAGTLPAPPADAPTPTTGYCWPSYVAVACSAVFANESLSEFAFLQTSARGQKPLSRTRQLAHILADIRAFDNAIQVTNWFRLEDSSRRELNWLVATSGERTRTGYCELVRSAPLHRPGSTHESRGGTIANNHAELLRISAASDAPPRL